MRPNQQVHPEEYWFRARLPVKLRTCWDRTRLLVHEKFPCRSEYLAVRLRISHSRGDSRCHLYTPVRHNNHHPILVRGLTLRPRAHNRRSSRKSTFSCRPATSSYFYSPCSSCQCTSSSRTWRTRSSLPGALRPLHPASASGGCSVPLRSFRSLSERQSLCVCMCVCVLL